MSKCIDTLPCGCKLTKEDWLYKVLNKDTLSLNQSRANPRIVEKLKLLKVARMRTSGSAPQAQKPKSEIIVISDSD